MSGRTVQRLAAILAALRGGGALTVSDLSRAVGLPYATCHRLVQAMLRERLLTRDEHTRRIGLPH